MYQVVYVSAARRELPREELAALLAKSRVNNARLGITGMLLYHEGNFMQALEGEREVVEALMAKIERDARHGTVMVLLRRETAEREFAAWSMGLVSTRGLSPDDLAAYSPLLRDPDKARHLFTEPDLAYKVLLSFRSNVR